MDQIAEFTLQNWGVIGIVIVVAIIIFIWGIQRIVDHRLDKRQEAFRTEQSLILAKFEIETRAKFDDIAKIHEIQVQILPELWKELSDARRHILKLLLPLKLYAELVSGNDVGNARNMIDSINTKECISMLDTLMVSIHAKQIFLSSDLSEAINTVYLTMQNTVYDYNLFISLESIESTPGTAEKFLDTMMKRKDDINSSLLIIEKLIKSELGIVQDQSLDEL